jgi:hypothetical protein
VYRWPFTGGLVQFVATAASFSLEHYGQDLALDADYVYVSAFDHGTISRVPKAGGPVETIATGQVGAYAIALAGDDVYWTNYDAGVVARAPKAGGPTVIISASEVHPTGLAVEGGHVYWTARAVALVHLAGGARRDDGRAAGVHGTHRGLVGGSGRRGRRVTGSRMMPEQQSLRSAINAEALCRP